MENIPNKQASKYKNYGENIVPQFDNISPFGNIPYFLSLASGFILMLLVIIIFIKIDKARHLVFYEFDSVDPFFTTYLIFIFGFLCSSIFVYELKTDPQFDQKDKNKIEASIPRIIYIGNILLSILPSGYWLAILFYNNPFSHIYSIAISVMMIFYLSTIYLNIDYKFRKIADSQSKLSIAINKAHFDAINKFLLIIISIIFLYFLFKYEIPLPEFIENIKTKLTFNSSINNHFLYITGILAVSYFYHFWDYIKQSTKNYYFFILFFIIIISLNLISIGTIASLDVIILYIIIFRCFIFLISEILKILYIIFIKHGFKNFIKKSSVKFSPIQIFSLVFLVFLVMIATINIIADDKSSYDSQYSFELTKLQINTSNQVTLSDSFREWITNRKNNGKPIIIISGQGGGSRAGCSMYAALAKLDTIDYIKDNILAITTISGSSNGALFYLASKYLNKFPNNNLESNALNLYNNDYVTKSMYKMLFTDRYLYQRFIPTKFINRNDNLIDLESAAFSKTIANNNLEILKKMQWSDWYKDEHATLPIFLPISYNISLGKPSISSPYKNDIHSNFDYHSILDSLKSKNNGIITISQSVSLSQMFPFISASATVGGDNYIDGGVYDNFAFESLEALYHTVKKIRNEIDTSKKIIMISVENGKIDHERRSTTSQLQSLISSVTKSIFHTNPIRHLNNLRSELSSNDTIINLKIYPDINENKENKYTNLQDFFKIKTDNSYVVMSRYLTKSEVDTIIKLTNQRIKTNITRTIFTGKN